MKVTTSREVQQAIYFCTNLTFPNELGCQVKVVTDLPFSLQWQSVSPSYSVLILLGVSSKHVFSKTPRDSTEMTPQSHLLLCVITVHANRKIIYMYLHTYISSMGWLKFLTVPVLWDFRMVEYLKDCSMNNSVCNESVKSLLRKTIRRLHQGSVDSLHRPTGF